MELFKHYLKIAYRNILKRKGQSLIGIIGLAMSIMAFTSFVYILQHQSTFNYKLPHYKQIGRVEGMDEEQKHSYAPWKGETAYRILTTPIDGMVVKGVTSAISRNAFTSFQLPDEQDAPYITYGVDITEGIIDIFSVHLLSGTIQDIFKHSGNIILSESMARKVYGEADPTGYVMEKEGEIYTIRGVMKDIPVPNTLSYYKDINYLKSLSPENIMHDSYYQIHTLLDKNRPLTEINTQLKHIGPTHEQLTPYIEDPDIKIFSAKSMRMEVIMTVSLGLIVLLTGIINFLTINIGTFYNRNKELVLRKIIGSITSNLFGLLLTELTILITGAFLLSICFTEGLLPVIINSNLQKIGFLTNGVFYFPTGVLIKSQLVYFIFIWSFCALITFLSTLRLQKVSVMQGFKGSNYNQSKHRVRNVILGIQFFISILFLSFTAILHVQSKAVGNQILSSFSQKEQKRTFVINTDYNGIVDISGELFEQLKKHTSIEDALITDISTNISNMVYERSTTPSGTEYITRVYTGENFAQFFRLSLLSGNYISTPNSILVSKDFYNLLLNTGEQGGSLLLNDNNYYRIEGIVDNFFTQFENKDPGNNLFIIRPTQSPGLCYLKAVPGREKDLKKHIETTLRRWIPESLPLDIETSDKIIGKSKNLFEVTRNIALLLSVICISLTLLGIYSAVTLDTEKRQKEVGIRKVNGATMWNIALHFGKLYLYIYLFALIITIPLLIMICTFIYNQFNISYHFWNPLFWIILVVLIFLIILSIVGYRLYKISRINPAETIKTE